MHICLFGEGKEKRLPWYPFEENIYSLLKIASFCQSTFETQHTELQNKDPCVQVNFQRNAGAGLLWWIGSLCGTKYG